MMNTRQTRVVMVQAGDGLADETRRRLESRGYEVHYVFTGEEAAREIQREPSSVDLVVIDAALGNAMVGTAAAGVVLAGGLVPVVLLVSAGETADVSPEFTCHGCVAKDAGAAVLDACLKLALRLFDRERDAHKRQEQLEQAAARAEEYAKPRIPSIREYAQLAGFNCEEALNIINAAPKLY